MINCENVDYLGSIMNIISIISVIVAILSFWSSQRQKQIVRAGLWALYIKQQNNYNISQYILALSKQTIAQYPNRELELLSSATRNEAFDQHLLEDIMSQIFTTDGKLTVEKVEKYHTDKVISDYDKKFLLTLLNEPPTLSYIHKIFKFLGIPL